MHLTLHTDYGLRVLLYLAAQPERVVPTVEIGRAYGISKNHLVRVAQSLQGAGFIDITAGRAGGLALAKPPGTIRCGDVVRSLEPDLCLVECFDAKTSTCPITAVCALSRAIDGALAAFLATLDGFTIGEVVARSGPALRSHFLPLTALVRGRAGAAGKRAAGKGAAAKKGGQSAVSASALRPRGAPRSRTSTGRAP